MRPVSEQPPGSFTQHSDKFIVGDDDIDCDTVAESDMSLKSGSFLQRVNDRVRKMEEQSSKMQRKTATNILWYGECLRSSTLEPSVFMGKNYSENLHSIKKKGKNLTLKQMFDISEKLIVCYALERCTRTQNQIMFGKISWLGSRVYRTWDTIDGEPMEFEWHIFQGFTTLQPCNKVQEFLSKMSKQPEEFTGRIIFMSMFKDISWGSQDNEQECDLSSKLVCIYASRFSPGRWSFLGLGSETKWYSTTKKDQEENGIESLNWWW